MKESFLWRIKMFVFFISLIITIMLAFGMSIALVEKGNDFPIRPWRIRLQLLIRKVAGRKFSRLVKCTTCSSFWTALIADVVVCLVNLILFGTFYFFWPFSGFIALGVTWFLIELLNALD
jgi:hypothetical protein